MKLKRLQRQSKRCMGTSRLPFHLHFGVVKSPQWILAIMVHTVFTLGIHETVVRYLTVLFIFGLFNERRLYYSSECLSRYGYMTVYLCPHPHQFQASVLITFQEDMTPYSLLYQQQRDLRDESGLTVSVSCFWCTEHLLCRALMARTRTQRIWSNARPHVESCATVTSRRKQQWQ